MARLACPACSAPLDAVQRQPGATIACPKCGRRIRLAAPAAPLSPAEPPAPLVDPSRYRRKSAGPSRLPAILGAGVTSAVLFAVVAAFIGLGAWSGTAPPTPPATPVAQAPPTKAKPDNPAPPEPISRPRPPETPPPDKPPTPPPADVPPAAPEEPDAWKEIALADAPQDLASKVIEKINGLRKAAGLPPVTVDADACAACAAHAAYLACNAGRIAALQLSIHAEDAALPRQSDAGRKAAIGATIAAKEPLAALDDWSAVPAHRALLLHPNLKTVGIGFARNAKDQWESVFDLSGATDSPSTSAVLYPAAGQTDVPLFFPGVETPSPLPDAAGSVRPAGFPVTVTFLPKGPVKFVAASLEGESGKAVEAWVSSPESPANKRFADLQHNTVCLIAKSPLAPGVRYAALVSTETAGRSSVHVWSFLTAGPDELRRDFEDRFLERINDARRRNGLLPLTLDAVPSLACAAHARYIALNITAHPNGSLQEEKPDGPSYTEEGKEIAGRSITSVRPGTPESEVDLLMSRVGFRTILLEPNLRRLALGSAWVGSATGAWVMESPRNVEFAENHPPICYPLDDQKNVGLVYGPEAASVVPDEGKGKPAGLPVTVRFPWHKPLDNVVGRLADSTGSETPVWLSTPQRPLPNISPATEVCLLPHQPLREGETYTVTVTADTDGKPWKKTWSFTTKKRDEIDIPAVEAKVLARVNEVRNQAGLKPVEMDASLSRGCQLHAHYLVVNRGRRTVEGTGGSGEDKTLPGATPEGAKAARASVADSGVADPAGAVDGWMRMFFHRVPVLDPDLRRIGFGCAQAPDDTWVCVMDVVSGK